MNGYQPIGTTTPINTPHENYCSGCAYRLPCGICTRTNQICPLGRDYGITWQGPTCEDIGHSNLRGVQV